MCPIKIGPAFPSAGGLFLEFPTFDFAIRITLALENLQSCPKIILLPTIHVRITYNFNFDCLCKFRIHV